MADESAQIIAEWHRLALSDDERKRALAARLLTEPVALRYFPHFSHAGLHVSRNATPPRDASHLPWILTDTADGSYAAIDGNLTTRGSGHLDEAVEAFLAMLRSVK